MNRKIVIGAVLIAIIAASIAAWFVHNQISELQSQNIELQNQINELQDQNNDLQDKNDELQEQLDLLQKRIDFSPEVLITNFSSAYGWLNLVGVAISIDLKITISNIGISDVEGLTLEIKRLNVDDDPHNVTIRLGILHAGETTEFLYCYDLDWNVYFSEFHNRSLEAALKLGEVVLDVRHFLPSQYL